jgi:hypothetical protein
LRVVDSAAHSTFPTELASRAFSKRLLPLAICSLATVALLAFPSTAHALCANPAGAEGEIVYNDTYNVVQFCDGTSWISMTGAIASSMDSRIGSIVNDKWCGADSSGIINCTLTPPASTSSGSVGYIQFSNAGGAFADSGTTPGQELFWDNTNKRLGIGTAAPGAAIEAVGTIKASSGLLWSANGSAATLRNLLLENFDPSASANGVDVGVKLGGTEFQGLSWVKETAWDAAAAAGTKDAMLQLGVLNDNVAANRVYVRADGKVGIGVAAPVAALDVNGGVRIGDQATCTNGTHNGTLRYNGGNLQICGSSGWVAAGGGGSGTVSGTAGQIAKFTSASAVGDSVITESGGKIGIGTTTPQANLDLSINGAMRAQVIYLEDLDGSIGKKAMLYNNHESFSVARESAGFDYEATVLDVNLNTAVLTAFGSAYKPGGGAWAASSDARLKDIDGAYEQGLASIVRLNTVRFHYKTDNPRKEPSDRQFVGLIAQEVENIFPEAVSTRGDGYRDLDTTPINFALINAVKELKANNDNLRAELRETIDSRDAQIERLGQEVEALKAAREQ